MAEHLHSATFVASYLSAVDSEDDSDSVERSYSDQELSDNSEDDANEPSSSHVDPSSSASHAEDGSSTITPGSSSDVSLVAKKDTKSQVWRNFGLKQVDGRIVETDQPVCRQCFVQVRVKLGNTSTLYSHLKTNHPDL